MIKGEKEIVQLLKLNDNAYIQRDIYAGTNHDGRFYTLHSNAITKPLRSLTWHNIFNMLEEIPEREQIGKGWHVQVYHLKKG